MTLPSTIEKSQITNLAHMLPNQVIVCHFPLENPVLDEPSCRTKLPSVPRYNIKGANKPCKMLSSLIFPFCSGTGIEKQERNEIMYLSAPQEHRQEYRLSFVRIF